MEWRDRRESNTDDKSVFSKEVLDCGVLRASLNSVLSLLYWSFDVRERYARPGKNVAVRAAIAGPNLVGWIILGEGNVVLGRDSGIQQCLVELIYGADNAE